MAVITFKGISSKETGNTSTAIAVATYMGGADKLKELVDDETELISVYYGADVSEEDAEGIASRVNEDYPDLDVEVNYGGQPIYYYLISIE